MTKVRVNAFGLSLDGFGAAPGQSLEHPFGVGGMRVGEWFTRTRTFHTHLGLGDDGTTGVDDDLAQEALQGLGAWILGRNMFTHERGVWAFDWKGWWGPNPPYHTPVFVLTHYPRASIEMEGGTTFHFVTDGIQAALERALAAAGGKDVRIGGGASTIRQFLQARLIDEMHLAIVPVVLGRGESLLGGLDLIELGYRVTGRRTSETVLHVTISKLA